MRALPGLGDLLCVVPALRALRNAQPTARITLIGLPWAAGFVERFRHYIDDWLEFPGFPGIPEGWSSPDRVSQFLAQVQEVPFDWAMQMHGSGAISNLFTVLLGAKANAGFFLPGQYCPDSQRFLPYPEAEPEVRRHLRLLEFLGVPLQGEELEFPLKKADWEELASLERPQQPYVCVHPGASVAARRWSPLGFASVADALARRGYQIVLTGTAAERELTQTVAQAMQCSALDLAGRTSLGALAALLQQAALLVCNDTGVSHLAAALEVNSVVIFSDSDPRRWSPLNRQRHRVILKEAASLQAVLTAAAHLLEEVYA